LGMGGLWEVWRILGACRGGCGAGGVVIIYFILHQPETSGATVQVE